MPQLYAEPRPGDLAASGALLGGNEAQLSATQELRNSGTIQGRRVVNISVGADAKLNAGNDISLAASQSTRTLDLSWMANSGNAISSRNTSTRIQEASALQPAVAR